MPGNLLSQLVDAISIVRPKHADYLHFALQGLLYDELVDVDHYLSVLRSHGETIESIRDAYCVIYDDTMEEQLYFQRNRRYRYQTFTEVAGHVYLDESYMHKYMIGLAISLYLWPNHRATDRFFSQRLPKNKSGTYLEVGPGHGSFLLKAMRDTVYTDFTGVDVSPTSIRLTDEIVQAVLPEKRARLELILADFLTSNLSHSSFDAIIMGEVLEHVEDPQSFLNRIAELSALGAFLFVTTCINAPEIDHIYLYRKETEVLEMFEKAGLEVVEGLAVPHHGCTLERCIKMDLPINVAYELRKLP